MKQKAIGATGVSALLCASILWAPSCSTPPLTEIIVHVDSAFPDGVLDMIRLTVVRDDEIRIIDTGLDDVTLPFTQGVVHRGGQLTISITALGIDRDGREIVTQLVPVERFIVGATKHVDVLLSPRCIDVMCETGSACMDGMCVSTSMDAGVVDAGGSDVGFFDARPLVDALADAGTGECPSGRTDIEGDFVCAADCDNCDVRCRSGDCQVFCRSGATCNVEAEGGSRAVVECEAGSVCNLKTKRQSSLSAHCVDSTCDVDCNNDSTCDVDCDNSRCEANCRDNPNCRLVGCVVEDCGNFLVCGRDCPPR